MMKKIIVVLLTLVLLGSNVLLDKNEVKAETVDILAVEEQLSKGDLFTVGKLTYEVLSNNTVEVYICDDSDKEIEVPEYVTYNGFRYDVIKIGQHAFSCCEKVTNVIIPNSVTSIDIYAFYSCANLTSVTIPNTVTSIGDSVFSNCKNLKSVTISNSVTSIGDEVFSNCTSLTSIIIPNGVTSIGDSAFWNCTSLTTIKIPDSVINIEDFAFFDCTNLTSVIIPSSVTNIGSCSFMSCDKITLYVEPNSYALQYAKDNKIPYKLYTNDWTTYPDVKKSDWYYGVVETATARGLMGVENKNNSYFSPNKNLSRGMVATVLYRMAGTPKVTYTSKFPDVKKGLWYSNAIIWANNVGIVNGYKTGKFGPDNNITREELAIMLYNYASKIGKISTNERANVDKFKDVKGITSYAKPAIQWAVAKGIISGKDKGTRIAATENATRAESAKMFVMLQDLVKNNAN